MTAIVDTYIVSVGMMQPGCSNDEHLQAWYQCTFWVVRSSQKFVPSTYVGHIQRYTLSPVYI